MDSEEVLRTIDSKFYEDVLADEHLSQIVLDWEEYREWSGYSADDLKGYVLKDMVIEMKRLLDVRRNQIHALALS